MPFKGLDKVIANLQSIKNVNNTIRSEFIRESLFWIADKANSNLDKRTQHFWGSEARLWNYKIYSHLGFGVLENQDMNSAAIEFGIGEKGIGSNEINLIAQENNWVYNIPTQYKDNNGYWTFKDARTGIWLTFKGYEGKSFLYDAFVDYLQRMVWLTIYKQVLDDNIRRVVK